VHIFFCFTEYGPQTLLVINLSIRKDATRI
jgi:hypothetical protein